MNALGAEPTAFAAWAHVEAMGHRSHWGSVTEQVIAGAAFLRIDVFAADADQSHATFFYPPGSIYCLTPCTEAQARERSTPFGSPLALDARDDELEMYDLDDEADDPEDDF